MATVLTGKFSAEEAGQRVETGLELLRDKLPSEVVNKLSKRGLDMRDFQKCIGGQLTAAGVDLFTEVIRCDASTGVECGFDLAHSEATPENYAILTKAWQAAL